MRIIDDPACIDSGHTAFMLYAVLAVFLMTPAAGMLQAGMLRRKNALSMLMDMLVGSMLISLVFSLVGFSVAFGSSMGGLFGNPVEYPLLYGVYTDVCFADAPTIPALLYFAFQMQFAVLTPLILSAAWAERIRFERVMVILAVWVVVVYAPIAHWLWAPDGWLRRWGALDFAGGFVVHGTAGIGGLVIARLLARRNESVRKTAQHHDLVAAFWGNMLTLACWYSFNGGSSMASDGQAARALVSTHLAASTGVLTNLFLARLDTGRWSFIAALGGIVTGSGSVTAGSGYIEPWAAVILGALGSAGAHYASKGVKLLRVEDVLDCFAAQAIPGIIGGVVGVGFFAGSNTEHLGIVYSKDGWALLGKQLVAMLATGAWAAFGTLLVAGPVWYFRFAEITAEHERLGLDVTQLGMTAYDLDATGAPTVGGDVEGDLYGKQLREAAKANDVATLRRLLFRGARSDVVDLNGRSALHHAAANGHMDATRVLLSDPLAPLNRTDRWGQTPLHMARRNGHEALASALIAAGAHLHVADDTVSDSIAAALFLARSEKTARSCLECGAVVDARRWDGATALLLAIDRRRSKVARLLLQAGASPNAPDIFGATPMSKAADTELAKLFLEPVSAQDAKQLSSLSFGQNPKFSSAPALSTKAQDIPSAAPPPPRTTSSFGVGAAPHDLSSSFGGGVAPQDSSLGAGALVKPRQGSQAWKKEHFLSLNTSSEESLRAPLLRRKMSDPVLRKPNLAAARWLRAGSAVLATTSPSASSVLSPRAETPLPVAPEPSSPINEHSKEAILTAAATGDVTELRRLYRRGDGVQEATDEHGATALHLAASSPNGAVAVRWLLRRGRLNPRHVDHLGRSALFMAVFASAPECALAILEAAPSLTPDYHTLLFLFLAPVAAEGDLDTLRTRIEDFRLSDLNLIQDQDATTLLHAAAIAPTEAAVTFLLSAGVRPTTNAHGRTPKDYAIACGHPSRFP